MTAGLRSRGEAVHHTCVGRRRPLGWEAIPPQPRLRQPAADRVISPDRWRGLTMPRGNQVGRAERTDVRLAGGLVDLGAVSAWCSRYVRAWTVSSPTAVAWCVEAVEPAIRLDPTFRRPSMELA
jgi:hypothetical protein